MGYVGRAFSKPFKKFGGFLICKIILRSSLFITLIWLILVAIQLYGANNKIVDLTWTDGVLAIAGLMLMIDDIEDELLKPGLISQIVKRLRNNR